MIPQVLLTGLGKVAFALLIGAVGVFMGVKLIARLAKLGDTDEQLQKGNNAVAILFAGSVIALGLQIQPATNAAFATLDFLRRDESFSVSVVARFLGYAAAHAALALVIGTLVIGVGLGVFLQLTRKLDELEEIRKGNIAPAIVLSAVMIVLAVLTAPGLEMALNGLLPIPPLPANVQLNPS